MDDLDTERFIDEVKKRKEILFSSSEEYKNRNPNKSQWIEILLYFTPCSWFRSTTWESFSVGVPTAKRGRT
jgi:hypothetical protein